MKLKRQKNSSLFPTARPRELPFQALIHEEQKYLIKKYSVSYSPLLGFLNQSQPSSPADKKNRLLSFANSLPSSAPLPETEKEVNTINKYYSKSDVFTRVAATETRFKDMAPQATLIHLAVHGEINFFDPFDSALLLTPTTKEDGRLTVSEILDLNLSANLIVLSSYDTSNGQIASGEGLLSLTWAFLAAGAKDVVAAQWAVEEKATTDLIFDFYRTHNRDSKSPANALRAAQLEALKQNAPFNHPFYWAAFVLIGGSH